ncbi:MAG: hypothetical protein FWD91_07305 [Treponema sp.]|nr:hypothetical protein [Treponema sp.]
MIDVTPIGFDHSIMTQSIGSGVWEAAAVAVMLGFLVWTVKLAFQSIE